MLISQATKDCIVDPAFEGRGTLIEKGFLPHQRDLVYELNGDNVFDFWAYDGQARPAAHHFVGKVFTDGSCFKGPTSPFSRAGWSVVVLWADGSLRAAICGPVWKDLPQTSQAADFIAFTVAVELATSGCEIYCDFKGLVDLLGDPIYSILDPHRKYAGFLRSAMSCPSWGRHSVLWVRAHQDLQQHFASEEEKYLGIGNDFADKWAKKGANMHQEPVESSLRAK